MPVILLAHRDPQLRASLGSALTARGFEVLGVDSIDAALDAAAAGATAMLVEVGLLADEDLEVKTRLDLRAGRPVRILALTHRASAEEMTMLKRHGAGLLSRPIEDVERMAKMLNIAEEAAAPWEGSTPAPPPRATMAPTPAPPPRATIAPTPAPPPRATIAPTAVPPPRATIAPVTAPVVPPPAMPEPPAMPAAPPPPVSPPASPSSTFKPPPANFMPPDLSKSFPAAPRPMPPPSEVPPPTPAPVAPAFAAPPAVPPPIADAPPASPATGLRPAGPVVSSAVAEILEEERFDDAATSIAPPPAPPPAVPAAPAPPPPATAAALWADDTETDIDRPELNTNVFVDEPQASTNKIAIPGETSSKADPLPPEIPEERTQVIPELAESAIPAKPSADPFEGTNPGVPGLANISATVSEAWFSDSENDVRNASAATGPSVLVVDDEPAFRTFLKDALGTQGYRVHTAINGPNALRFVKTQPAVDLVISDLHMPHMDGFELKHEIDQILGRSMPFIVCTADANDDKIQTAAQVGAAALVPKPIENLDAFFAIVTDTLKDAGVLARTATS